MSLGTLATGIAHEINNPLAIINESAGFMKQVITEPEKITLSYTDALLMGIEKIEKSVQRRAGLRISYWVTSRSRTRDFIK